MGITGICYNTILNALPKNIRRHGAAMRNWLTRLNRDQRIDFATEMKAQIRGQMYRKIRYSDETHVGPRPARQAKIPRQSGEHWRLHPRKVQEQRQPTTEEEKHENLHLWACIGWEFKSKLYRYKVPTNVNGKLTAKIYVEILEAMVKPMLDKGDDFILEEDGDTSHRGPRSSKTNIARQWKEKHPQLKHYTNAPHSPDLAPIEVIWEDLKQLVDCMPHYTEEEAWNLCQQAWEEIPQRRINELVERWPHVLLEVVQRDGAITGH